MTKLYSAKAEALAIRAFCSTKADISNLFVARVDRNYFHTVAGKEAYKKVQSHISRKGFPPSFRLLCEDISLSEKARTFIANATTQIRTTKAAEELISNLDKYRKTRGMFKIAEGMIEKLKADSIEPQEMLDELLSDVADLNRSKASEDTIFTIGVDSTIGDVVEDLLDGEDSDIAIPTGFPHYDLRNGGFFRSSLIVIGGASGAGKCCFKDTLVTLPTLVFELEDDVTLEAEPHELVWVNDGETTKKIRAIQINETHEIITDPDALVSLLLLSGLNHSIHRE